MVDGFIPKHGGYKNLLSYRKAEIVYDATYHFCRRFIDSRSRTTDQMVQAARSGKSRTSWRGSLASGTSKEAEIKLTNVARASLGELLEDYQDYLRVNKLQLWDKNSAEARETRRLGVLSDFSYATFEDLVERANVQTAANTIICLIYQTTYLLDQQIRRLEADFVKDGGLRERMTQARIRHRNKQNEPS